MIRNIRRLALAALSVIGIAGTASAGWNNVAQLTCGDCRTRSSYRVQDCEKPEVRTSYIQRTYYQPTTEYRVEKYMDPVRVNVRSSFYEPVTTYSYSSYYDPCSGRCQQIQTPHTEYRLRSECNTAYKYVERTRMVPVQTMKPVTMLQPVVTYYYPPRPTSNRGGRLYSAEELGLPAQPAPNAEIERTGGSEKIINPNVPSTPPKPLPSDGVSRARTASYSQASALRGEVVERDRATPRGNMKIIFVNATDDSRKEMTTNQFGEFDMKLPAGEWYIYLGQGNGKAAYHSTVKLQDGQTRDVTVASR